MKVFTNAGVSSTFSVIAVRMIPGDTAFTRTPSGASSSAMHRVNCSTAALLAAYALRLGQVYFAQIEPTLTIDPPPALWTRGDAALQQRNTPDRFVEIVSSQVSSSSSASDLRGKIPAELTTTWSEPSIVLASANARGTLARSRTSMGTPEISRAGCFFRTS